LAAAGRPAGERRLRRPGQRQGTDQTAQTAPSQEARQARQTPPTPPPPPAPERSMRARPLLILTATVAFALALASPAGAAFGLKGVDMNFAEEDGSRAAQAGSHPFAIATRIEFNTVAEGPDERPDGQVRNLEAVLPTGLVGDPNATPQ